MDQSKITFWERKGDIGILSISNDKENYLDEPDFVEIDKLKQWAGEDGLKGIIIRGVGRNFSAGANLEYLNKLAENRNNLENKIIAGKEILNFIEDLEIPVIAAINGVCFGGGLEIALACHMRVAGKSAIFAFPEVNHGLIPGLGGVYRLSNLIGKNAYDIILNGDMLNAKNAKTFGLVNYVSDSKDSFLLAENKLTSMTSDRSIELINYAMRAINNALRLDRDEALNKETELFCELAVKVNSRQQNKDV